MKWDGAGYRHVVGWEWSPLRSVVASLGGLLVLLLSGCREVPAQGRGAEELLTAHFASARSAILGERESAGFVPGAQGFERVGTEASGLQAWLPSEGSGEVRLVLPGGLTVSVRELEGAGPGRLVGPRDGAILYEGEGRASFWTAVERGIEHWVLVERPVQARVASYEVRGAGVRQVGERVEVVDARGRARLVVSAPRAFAADGTPVQVRLVAGEGRVDVFAESVTEGPLLVDPLWQFTGTMTEARSHHTATPLADGTVFVTGGAGTCCPRVPLSSTERYDPATGVWTASAAMGTARSRHTATLLEDNSVLVAGGITGSGTTTAGSAERFNPVTGSWSVEGTLLNARANHTATRLPAGDGRVLVAGGESGTIVLNAAELYTPSTRSWSLAGLMTERRSFHTSTLLPNGRVLVVGGTNGTVTLASAEYYNAALGTWVSVASMNVPRRGHTATLLADGRVLVVGGINDNGQPAQAELYDPAANTWTLTGSLTSSRHEHTATRLPDGRVLIAGGRDPLRSIPELYEPVAGTFRTAGCLLEVRVGHTATLVSTTPVRVLVAGGLAAQTLATSELYDPEGGLPVGTACNSDCDCGSGFCENGFCCDARCGGACDACDGRSGTAPGTCSVSPDGEPGAPSCTPYLCGGTSANCPMDCVDDTDCVSSHRCEANVCVPRKAPGTPCDADLECASGLCVDGVCCDSRCEGACNACNVPGSAGTCSPTPRGTPGSPSCSPYTCQGGADCPTSCTTNGECAPGHSCQNGQCVPGNPGGSPCSDPSECASGFCADGVCCDSACEGSCNACNLPGKEGVCSNVPMGAEGSPVCAPFTCSGGAQCATTCVRDEECVEGARCRGGVCVYGRAGYLGYSYGCGAGGGGGLGWSLAAVLLLFARSRFGRRGPGAVTALALGGLWMGALVPAEAHAQDRGVTSGAPGEWSRLHLGLTVFNEFISRQVGGEVSGSYSVLEWLDLGVAVPVGDRLGGRVTVLLQRPATQRPRLSPFVQLRGVVHPVRGGVGWGGGAWAGGALELGPGRLRVGALGEVYQGPAGYFPYALVAMAGYELDPFHTRERLREVVRPGATTGVLRGQVTDLEDNPLRGEVVIRGEEGEPRLLPAQPHFALELPPGTYHVQAHAPGHLARARTFTLSAGESIVSDFHLRAMPGSPTAKLTEDQIVLSQTLPFEFSAARILPEAYPMLDEVVDILLNHPSLKVRIVGHTDNVGTPEYNQQLSEGRARAVREYLLDKGVSPARLTVQGFGATQPLAPNDTEEGRAKNRRVQFQIFQR